MSMDCKTRAHTSKCKGTHVSMPFPFAEEGKDIMLDCRNVKAKCNEGNKDRCPLAPPFAAAAPACSSMECGTMHAKCNGWHGSAVLEGDVVQQVLRATTPFLDYGKHACSSNGPGGRNALTNPTTMIFARGEGSWIAENALAFQLPRSACAAPAAAESAGRQRPTLARNGLQQRDSKG